MHDKQLRLFAPQKEVLVKLKNMLQLNSDPKTIILSGKSGSGKSTILRELVRGFSGLIRGYTTVRHRNTAGNRAAFQHVLLPASAIPAELTIEYPDILPADLEYFLIRDEDKVEFDRDAFLKLADYMSPEQIHGDRQPELMLWDEVGGEELLIDNFFEILLYWLEKRAKPSQIIVWKKQRLKSKVRLAHLKAAEMDLLDKRRKLILNHPAVHIYDLDSDGSERICI